MTLDELQKLCDEATPIECTYCDDKLFSDEVVLLFRKYLPLLLAVARAAESEPCRHSSDHRPDNCDMCIALAALKEAE